MDFPNCNHCQFTNEDDLCNKGHIERQSGDARFASKCPDFQKMTANSGEKNNGKTLLNDLY